MKFHQIANNTVAFAVLSLMIADARSAADTWELTLFGQESGTDKTLRDIHFLDHGVGWIVGDSGTILHTKNGGETWQSQKSPTSKTLLDIYMIDTAYGWITMQDSSILRTVDGGEEWERIETLTANPVESVHFLDRSNGWAAGWNGTLIQSTDGGLSWQESPCIECMQSPWGSSPAVAPSFGAFCAIPSQDLVLAGSYWGSFMSETYTSPQVFRLNPAKTAWAKDSVLPGFTHVFFVDSLNGWGTAFTRDHIYTQSRVHRTYDGGFTWTLQHESFGYFRGTDVRQTFFVDAANGWALGDRLLASEDGGNEWLLTDADSNIYMDLWFDDSSTGWLVGRNGRITKVLGKQKVAVRHPKGSVVSRVSAFRSLGNSLSCKYYLDNAAMVTIAAYSMDGRLVLEERFGWKKKGYHFHDVPLSPLGSGLHHITLYLDGVKNMSELVWIK